MLFKLYANMIIFADGSSQSVERIDSYARTLLVFAPLAFVSELLDLWFIENKSFSLFVGGFVLANAIVGGIAHQIKGDFSWEKLLVKTIKMAAIIVTTYIILEGLVSPMGVNPVSGGLIAAFQVATLLYPGSKILLNIFIWSDGEHPPKWIMEKVYNFKKNGNLTEFLSENKKNETDDEFKQ